MKRIYKIISFALFATVFSLLVAVSSSAESQDLEIKSKGANFDNGEITLTFAVDSSESGALKLTVWDTYPISDTVALYETTEFVEMTAGDASYKVFSSSHVLLQNLRKPYYAAVSSIAEDGSVIARGKIVKFSVFDYFLDLLSTGTEDQITLFTKLLNIGAAMQKQLLGTSLYPNTELTTAGGYSNEYYALSTNTYVDGELTDSVISYYSTPTVVRLTAEKALDGASFVGFTDSEGAALKEYGELTSATWNEYPYSVCNVGISDVSLNYVSGSTLPIGYDKTNSVSGHGVVNDSGTAYAEPNRRGVTSDKNGVASTTAVAGSAYVALSSKSTEKFLGFYKIIKALSATTYPEGTEDTSGAYKMGDVIDSISVKNCGMSLPSSGVAENANLHVFETDIYVYCPNNLTPTYVNLLNSDGDAFWGFNITTAGSGSTFSLSIKGGEDDEKCFTEELTLRQREWYNLRIEYSFNENDEVEIKIYIDGKYVATYNSPTVSEAAEGDRDSTLSKVYFYHADEVNNVTLQLDNTIITSIKTD